MAVPTRKKNPQGRPEPKLFPEATYEALVSDAKEQPSKGSGNTMTVLELEIEHSFKPGEVEQKSIIMYVPHEDKDGNQTSWCESMIDALTSPDDPEDGIEPAALVGRRCYAVIIHEDDTWKGRTRKRERVDVLKRHPEGPMGDGAAAPSASGTPADEDQDLPF